MLKMKTNLPALCVLGASLCLSPLAMATLIPDVVPNIMSNSGRILDKNTNQPITGVNSLVLRLYSETDELLWEELQLVDFRDGYYTVEVGAVEYLPTELFEKNNVTLGISLNDDVEFSPRLKFHSIPYAFYSKNAIGNITPNSVTINGVPVIDRTGAWVGPNSNLKGPKGDRGYRGHTGDKGDTGARGLVGARGLQGPKGDKGMTGAIGPKGMIGATGPNGSMGIKGDDGYQCWDLNKNYIMDLTEDVNSDNVVDMLDCRGPVGMKGEIGPIGMKGDTGPAGADGAQGPIGLTGVAGPKGDTGPTGATGPKGDTGAGVPGPKGDTGPTGATGPKGDTGAAGAIDVNSIKYIASTIQFSVPGTSNGGGSANPAHSALCPAGNKVVGGGFRFGAHTLSVKVVPVTNGPFPDGSGWGVEFLISTDRAGDFHTSYTVHAICVGP